MRKIIIYTFTAILSILNYSCEGDLDPNLYGVISTEDAFSTQAGIEAATVSLYYELKQVGWGPYLFSDGSSFVMDEACTDEWTVKWGGWATFMNGGWTNTDAMSTGFYNKTAPNITRCTFVLEQIANSEVSDEIKDKYVPEIKALRAFFMFDLYRFYGPMPMILEGEMAVNPDPDYKPMRPSAEFVEDFIARELREAANVLPIEQPNYGRITKGAALHYLLKLRMWQKQWQDALDVINEIENLNYYSLQPNYADIFSAQNEKNKELIFVITGEPLEDYGNHVFANILPGNYRSPHGNQVTGWNGHRMPWAFYDTFDDQDSRKALIQASYQANDGSTVNLRNSDIGALPLKYGIDPNAIGTWAGNDKVMDRYSEVVLFKAEVLNELHGPTNESIKLINNVRARAFNLAAAQPERTLINEEFNTLDNNIAGVFEVNNYRPTVSTWEFKLDNTGLLSGDNSLYIKINSKGNVEGDLQVRNEKIPIQKDREYAVSFKIRSNSNVQFNFRAARGLNVTKPIVLTTNTTAEYEFDLGTATLTQDAAVFFALGIVPAGTEIWIDAVKLIEKEQDISQESDKLLKLTDFSRKEDLRDWILKERGWEFWYEGKRRDDLIRMDKYIAVGQSVAGNFSNRNLLFPIPRHVLIENHNIIQNAGY
ncbi:RagB/SusD family nutrient uptake outer membrane protein [Proteiniphilum sp. UBA5384]|mgnify:FL=1|jgi:hypothetical protein|uniref:RagB/SusD family nutrient uptake outer membrane protein n=1 Tax=Proteiniphilum sp. UBA5384 TaxID=1947279 RepID=UPI0025D428E8|nr:RagB/SusD family nutrient uptake outer membrane protein [Proteiniphilum sp. UBA5384]